jgi:Mg-chelatase subunit ChlD
MNTKLTAVGLIALTSAIVGLYPALRQSDASTQPPIDIPIVGPIANQQPKVEVAFVLDTTGSMSGLIQAAKEKIWSIASTIAAAQPAPEIRMGLVAYRDRGDDYVTRRVDLSSDLDSVYAELMQLEAQGGGDGPESVNQALQEAVEALSWSTDQDSYRVVFLVGDAPPHMDYQDDVKWPDSVERAKARGIKVNTIQCGTLGSTTQTWQRIASVGDGSFVQVEQGGGAVAIATPYDERLAKLAAELDGTRLFYGSEGEREEKRRKVEAATELHEKASVSTQARRAAFNATPSGKSNLLGDKELVEDVASGRVNLDAIPAAALPEPMQAMPEEDRKALIEEKARQRESIEKDMRQLAEQRAAYLRDQVEAAGGAEESLDHGIYRAIREQAAEIGLSYDAKAPAY